MNKAKFLLLGLHSLAEEIKLIMENFSKMLHAMLEIYRSTLRPLKGVASIFWFLPVTFVFQGL